MISEQALSQSERVTNLNGIKHSRTVSPLDGCTFQLAVPRVGQRWLDKMCRLVQWEKWGSNIVGERKKRVKSR